ncbi:MAG: fibronectin type III domain-containing protein [Ignavibacteriaceae bacterium]|nr:fibronectin type III domain-containing protein [Ignavibacteriaceae bacterium]
MNFNSKSFVNELTILVIAISIFSLSIKAQTPGTLDNTFGTDGKVITSLGTGSDIIQAIALQPDGKIVGAGYTRVGSNDDIAVVRYNADGTLDNTFGTGGIVVTPVGVDVYDKAYAVAIQQDGKIVVGGASQLPNVNFDWVILRYESSGVLDNSFGTGGIVITNFSSRPEYIYSILIQPDGKIVAAGNSDDDLDNGLDFTLIRLNTDGSFDNTFGSSGIVVTDFGTFGSTIRNIKLLGDNSIIAVGSVSINGNADYAIAKYNSSGVLDNSFGFSGIVSTPIGTGDDFAYSLSIQNDGKLILAGYTKVGSVNNFSLARYDPNGTLDNTFDTDGKVITSIGTGSANCYAVSYIHDFGIVAVGYAKNGANEDFTLAKYDMNGSLDNSFGTNGIVFTDFAAGIDFGYAMDVQPDGKIVVAGFATTSDLDLALARYFGKPLQLPSAPILVSPANGAVISSSSVLFIWEKSQPIVSKYLIEIDTTNQFNTPLVSTEVNDTTYLFTQLQPGKNYWWRVKAFNPAGWGDYSEVRTFSTTVSGIDDKMLAPTEFSLHQNYPNPFNPSTKIIFTLQSSGNAVLKIYDSLGEEIATLFDGYAEAGRYNEVEFKADNFVSGIYIARLQSVENVKTIKMLLLK